MIVKNGMEKMVNKGYSLYIPPKKALTWLQPLTDEGCSQFRTVNKIFRVNTLKIPPTQYWCGL